MNFDQNKSNIINEIEYNDEDDKVCEYNNINDNDCENNEKNKFRIIIFLELIMMKY